MARGSSLDTFPGQAVMICRDNDTRAQLNTLARAHRGEAGRARRRTTIRRHTPIAVGDRVICRHKRLACRSGQTEPGGTVRRLDDTLVVGWKTDAV